MTANGGVVKAKLILDSSEFSSGWKKALGELDSRINGPNLSGVKKELDDAAQAAKKTKSDIDGINNSRFDKLVSKLDGAIKRMQSSSSAGVRSIGNTISSGMNAVDFNNLSNKFTATIQKMQNTASSGVKSITNEFSNMNASLTDIFATVAGGAGLSSIFTYGMGRATTQAMLSNTKSPEDAKKVMQQYQAYTIASSTSDQDIQRVLKYVLQGVEPGQTYRALSAIDAMAYTPDPVQRQELLRNYGQYLTNGYSEALFRGDVTADEAAILKAAETPEERIAAMEQIAKGPTRGTMFENGENLSTMTTGPMGNYNKVLIVVDSLMRGMYTGFEKLLNFVSPIMDWFIGLDGETQNTVGSLIFFAGILGMAGGAVKVLGTLFKPFISIFKLVGKGALQVADKLKDLIPTDKIKSVLGKLKDIAGEKLSPFTDKVKNVFSSLKDKISTPLSNFKQAVIDKFTSLKDWIQNKWNPTPKTTPTSTGSGTSAVAPVGGIGTLGALGGFAGLVGGAIVGGYGFESLQQELGKYTLPGSIGEAQKYGLGMGGAIFTSFPGFGIGGSWGRQMAGGDKASWMEAMPGGSLLSYLYKGAGNLLPGTASATGKGGKSSIMQDITGKGGLLDMSRFKIPKFKWPSANQILKGISDKVKSVVPKFNWKIPTPSSIGKWIQTKIGKLNWLPRLPSVADVKNFVNTKIGKLNWLPRLPSLSSISQWVTDKIKWLDWTSSIPSLTDIKNIISGKIKEFYWPFGPAKVSSSGSGSGGGGSNPFGPPRGPIKDTIINTMAARSGVGSGYIASAMANRFSGLGGFNPIADGMAAPLSYSFYYGDQKTNEEVWRSGQTNCYDGAQFLMSEGNRFGLGGGLSNGVWDGTSIPHTWAVIGGQPFDMAAKLIRGYWNPPSGPMDDFDQFMTDIGPALEYIGYGGHMKNPFSALDSGGNCFDMTLGIMDVASALWGLPSQMVWGSWDDNSHVWARIGNRDYDLARRAYSGSYSPPPQGPGNANQRQVNFNITLGGTFVGLEQYKKEMKQIAVDAMETAAAKYDLYDFG